MALPRKTGGWGAILYSLKMANLAGGIWPMMRVLGSRNNCKSCALGMGGQKGGMNDPFPGENIRKRVIFVT